jgi:hypothetical protein
MALVVSFDNDIQNINNPEQDIPNQGPRRKNTGQCDNLVIKTDCATENINPNILPESESPARRYDCEDKIGPRPNRERVRGEIADYILLMLGAPVLDIELDRQQITLAVDEALRIFEEWAPASYFQYYTFETNAGQSVYELPCDIGIIRNVEHLGRECDASSQLGGGQTLGWIGDTGYGAGGLAWGSWGYNRHQPFWGNAHEWVMFKQYEETFERLSGRNGGWEFFQDTHTLKIYPVPNLGGGTVTIHYLQKKKNWPEVHDWMNNYGLCLAKIMLGRIRSKYSNIVSPGGGVTLDGQNLLTEGLQEKKDLEKDLIYRWNEPIPMVLG